MTDSTEPTSLHALSLLDHRRSTPVRQLGQPGPDDATLLRMLQLASRVPDHGKRVPFRFLRISGDARHALGEHLAALTLSRTPDAAEAAIDKDRGRFSHAPLVIAVVAVLDPSDAAIPEQERLCTAACACFALLQAAQGHGFGANWLTGWPAFDAEVMALLGLSANERIIGFIHIGTPQQPTPDRERPDAASLLSDWHPA